MPPHLMNGDMYPGPGQPLDHEPSMGQVPILPPAGTPPGDGWPHFNGLPHPGSGGPPHGGPYFPPGGPGRHSPHFPGISPQGPPGMIPPGPGGPDGMGMMGGPHPSSMVRMLADQGMEDQYNDCPPQTHNQLEVY